MKQDYQLSGKKIAESITLCILLLIGWLRKAGKRIGTKKRRIMAGVLSFTLLFGMLPMGALPAFAAGDVATIGSVGYADLQAAFDAVGEGQVIMMQSNITISDNKTFTTTANANFTLDLNGRTLNGGSGTAPFIEHIVPYTLTIQDSGSYGKITSSRAWDNYAPMILVGDDLTNTDVTKAPRLTVKSGTIENTAITSENFYANAIRSYGILSIQGGYIYAKANAIISAGALEGERLTVSGGVIKGDDTGILGKVIIPSGSPIIAGGIRASNERIDMSRYTNAKIMGSMTKTDGTELQEIPAYNVEDFFTVSKYKYLTVLPEAKVTLKIGESGTEVPYYEYFRAWKAAIAAETSSTTRAILTLKENITDASWYGSLEAGYVTIDTNGKLLQFPDNEWGNITIYGGDLSIIGNGIVEGKSAHAVVSVSKGRLDLTDITIKGVGPAVENTGDSGIFNMMSGTLESTSSFSLRAWGAVNNIYSGVLKGYGIATGTYDKLMLRPEANKTILIQTNKDIESDYKLGVISGSATVNGKGTVIIQPQNYNTYNGIKNGEATSTTRLKMINGTLMVDLSKAKTNFGYGAFANAPDFEANGYYKITAGANETSAAVVTNPTATTYTENNYLKIETLNNFAITLNENGGSYVDGYTKPTSYDKGVGAVLPTSAQITKNGYTFLGWTATNDATDTTYIATIPTTAGGDKTYYARWKANQYKLTVNYKYADGATASATHTEDIDFGTPYSVLSPAINGYTADIMNVAGTMTASGVTVNVTYTPNTYNVVFNNNGGSWKSYTAPGTYTYGVGVTLPTVEQIAKTGYAFLGWTATNEAGDTAYITNIPADATGAKTYYAKWEDITAPTGEIKIGTNSFKQFLNTITFGLFFKDTTDVTITAQDNSGETVTIEYVLSDTEVSNFESVSWTPYIGTITLNANRKVIVYAKLTDPSGKMTMINSDGVVLFTDSIAGTTSVTFTKKSTADVTATLNCNGNTVKEIRIGENVLMRNTDYTVSDGMITLKSAYLNTLAAGSYTVSVSYYPLGEIGMPKQDSDTPAATSFALTVSQVASAVSVVANPTGSQIRPNSITLSANLPVGATGTLQFKANGSNIGSPVLVGQTVSFTPSGSVNSYIFTVEYSGDDNFGASTSGGLSYSFVKGQQSAVSFAAGTPIEKTYGDAPFTVTATGGSGTGAVTYSVVAGPAAVSGGNVILMGAGVVTIRATKAADDNYNEKSVETTVNVNKKQVTIAGVTTQNKTYDGGTAATVSGTAAVIGKVKDDMVSVSGGTATFADKIVGNGKTVTFTGFTLSGADAEKYTLTAQPASVTANITAKPITATVTIQSKAYDGLNTAAISGAALNDVVLGDTVSLLTPYPAATFGSVGAESNIAVNFGGSFTLTGPDAGNYTLTQPSATGNITNIYNPVKGTDYTVNAIGWSNTDFVVIAKPGFELSLTNTAGGVWCDWLTKSDETATGSIIFYVRNQATGAISLAAAESYQIDKTAPTGDIMIGESSIRKVLNAITFGMFFKDTQNITVTSSDSDSGVASVVYKLSSTVLDETAILGITDWTAYTGTFPVQPDTKTVVYVKITDAANNVLYLGSNGLVIDHTAPVIGGIENGKVYCGDATVTAEDANLYTVTVNGADATRTNGKLTLSPAGTPQTVVATDKAKNRTTVTVMVYDVHEWNEGVVTLAPTASKKGVKTYTCAHCGETKTEEIDKLAPRITEGQASEWKQDGIKALAFRSNAAFSDFIRVLVNGKVIDAKYYDIKEGSIIVTLKADYLATLPAGTHTIGIQSTTGIASAEFAVAAKPDSKSPSKPDDKSPLTGDNSNMLPWAVLAFVSGGTLFAASGIRRRKKQMKD